MNLRINKTLRRKGIRKANIPNSAPDLKTQIQTPEENLMSAEINKVPQLNIKQHPNWMKV